MGRKLRIMSVEKGLLRETKEVQLMINALVNCRVRSHLPESDILPYTLFISSISTIWKMN